METRRAQAMAMLAAAGYPPVSGGDHDDPSDPPAPGNDGGGDPPQAPRAKVEFTPEQQEVFNRELKAEVSKAVAASVTEALNQERSEAEKKRKQEMQASLREQGKFEELNKTLTDEVTTLKDEIARLRDDNVKLRASAGKYEESVLKDYDTFVESMPVALRPFDPGPDADVDAKRSFMEQARDSIANMRTILPGTPPSPEPYSANDGERAVAEVEKSIKKRSTNYSRLRTV